MPKAKKKDLQMLHALVLQESGARTLTATDFYEVSRYVPWISGQCVWKVWGSRQESRRWKSHLCLQ